MAFDLPMLRRRMAERDGVSLTAGKRLCNLSTGDLVQSPRRDWALFTFDHEGNEGEVNTHDLYGIPRRSVGGRQVIRDTVSESVMASLSLEDSL